MCDHAFGEKGIECAAAEAVLVVRAGPEGGDLGVSDTIVAVRFVTGGGTGVDGFEKLEIGGMEVVWGNADYWACIWFWN